MRKVIAAGALTIGLSGLFSSQALAHYPWVNADGYSLHTGVSPKINIGYGHGYPLGSFLQQEDLEGVVLFDPAGKELPLKAANVIEYESEEALSEPGVYTVAAQRKATFYTKTTDGWKKQSKEGLDNVLRCSRSHKSAKALLVVDAEGSAIEKGALGHPLEIIPDQSCLPAGR